MKTIKIIIFMLLCINSFSQVEYLGKPLQAIKQDYDSIMYDRQDTLVVYLNKEECINFIADDNIITHFIKFMPYSKYSVIEEIFSTYIQTEDGEYYFEQNESLYRAMIYKLPDYFGIYVEQIE